jgi:hypothetical protein
MGVAGGFAGADLFDAKAHKSERLIVAHLRGAAAAENRITHQTLGPS